MTNPIQRNQVGDTSLYIPSLCFGTSGLGNMPETYDYEVNEKRAVETIQAILSGPVPFIDSSRNYGSGRSEERVGIAIRELGGLPSDAIVSSKLDRDMNTLAFDARRARQSLEESLKAMNLDHIDLLFLHDPEHCASLTEITANDGALAELMKMKEEGYCKAIGLAAGNIDIMLPIVRNWDFDAVITHNRHTLINENASPLIALAKEKNISVLNAAPYCGGALAKGTKNFKRYVYQQASETVLAPLAHVEALCHEYDIPPGAAALQYSMRDPHISSTICGVSKPERVQETLDWASFPIPEAAWQALMHLPRDNSDPEANRAYDPG